MTDAMKKPADILPRLLEWEGAYTDWRVQYKALQALTNCGPEAPIAIAMGCMWDAYSNCLGREIGDTGDWLNWYCWENEMGAKGLGVKSAGGKVIKVKTIEQLATVMCL
jgi:hypothetical protein